MYDKFVITWLHCLEHTFYKGRLTPRRDYIFCGDFQKNMLDFALSLWRKVYLAHLTVYWTEHYKLMMIAKIACRIKSKISTHSSAKGSETPVLGFAGNVKWDLLVYREHYWRSAISECRGVTLRHEASSWRHSPHYDQREMHLRIDKLLMISVAY